jgi:hypothetical protein
MAAAAKIVDGAKLDQKAMIAADDFPGIYRGKIRSHSGLGGARAGFPWNRKENQTRYWFQTCSVICGRSTVDVK